MNQIQLNKQTTDNHFQNDQKSNVHFIIFQLLCKCSLMHRYHKIQRSNWELASASNFWFLCMFPSEMGGPAVWGWFVEYVEQQQHISMDKIEHDHCIFAVQTNTTNWKFNQGSVISIPKLSQLAISCKLQIPSVLFYFILFYWSVIFILLLPIANGTYLTFLKHKCIFLLHVLDLK